MGELVFDFDLPGENGELRRRRGSFQVNPVVDRDPRMELRHFHECVTHVTAEPFQFDGPLPGRAGWPGFQAQENEGRQGGNDENAEGKRRRPGKFPSPGM
jgi:hypothetical protein